MKQSHSYMHPEACTPCTMCQQPAMHMTRAVTTHIEVFWRLCCECVLLQQMQMQELTEQKLHDAVSQSGCQGSLWIFQCQNRGKVDVVTTGPSKSPPLLRGMAVALAGTHIDAGNHQGMPCTLGQFQLGCYCVCVRNS